MSVILFISLIDFVLSSLAWVYYSHAFFFYEVGAVYRFICAADA